MFLFTSPNSDISHVHSLVETVLSSLSILLNIALLCLIAHHSTFGVRTYQVLLAIDATLDLLVGAVTVVALPVGLTRSLSWTSHRLDWASGRRLRRNVCKRSLCAFFCCLPCGTANCVHVGVSHQHPVDSSSVRWTVLAPLPTCRQVRSIIMDPTFAQALAPASLVERWL